MPLNICLEALIRLFFEIVRVLFGDVTLIGNSYLDSELPHLISTLKWVFFFTLVAMLSKNPWIKKGLIIGIPSIIGLVKIPLSFIPFIGPFLSVGAGLASAPIVVISWLFILWIDDKIHPLLKVFATPGIMICAALNSVFPTSIFGNLGYVFLMGALPEITAFFGLLVIGFIIILSPTFICSFVNRTLELWAAIRYEGFWAAIVSCLVIIKNKAIKFR